MERERLLLLGVAVALSACWFGSLALAQMIHPEELQALKAIRKDLGDPLKNLRNWKKNDPCTSNWTGVICTRIQDDGYMHIQELRLLRMNLTGTLAPALGVLSQVTILDFMWNNISGSIPKEIGDMTSLQLLLLSGNNISGPLPDELGFLPNITKFQLDLNYISGPLPRSFANLSNIQHFHMNNNSISGQIPPELSKLLRLKHFLLDNNNLSGYLPPELHMMPSLTILQLDNNKFEGNIPSDYSNMPKLLKLSLRNCNLTGVLPDFSTMGRLLYLDLSSNNLSGSIPTNKLSPNITTIDLSHNQLNGTIPSNFSGFSQLQKLSLQENYLSGDVPTNIWQNIIFNATTTLKLEFQNNALTNVVGGLNPPPNVIIRLQGNPVCRRENELNIVNYCAPEDGSADAPANSTNSNSSSCVHQHCPRFFDSLTVPDAPDQCYCSAPLGVEVRLRSPSISDFPPYADPFRSYITSSLDLEVDQLVIDSFIWQKGPRLRISLKVYPQVGNYSGEFDAVEVQRLVNNIATFTIPGNDTFGPYDLINFAFGYYQSEVSVPTSSGMSKGVVAAVVVASISFAAVVFLAIAFLFYRRRPRNQDGSRIKSASKVPMKVEGIKAFSFADLEKATSGFDITAQIGQGGYGKVFKGVLGDSTVVAIKRAHERSLQGQEEFFNEIEFLSRLHHRNLVALVGYCDEQSEQMLVYEFMPNGTLHNVLSGRYGSPLSFAVRLSIALGSAKGILYLHTEADPPIIHRDIKANNILLDSRFNAKVADFGISRLAPSPNTDGYETAHVSTNVKGTPGYLDPEYFLTHKLTEKSDVYSLGIVFLELLTGMKPISHGRNIVREVLQACQSGSMFSIIDRSMGPYPSECIKKFMALALKCCEDRTKARPTMLEVVRELENISSMLPETNTIASETETSGSGIWDSGPQPLYPRKSPYTSTDLVGSDLVSGVIPTVRPR